MAYIKYGVYYIWLILNVTFIKVAFIRAGGARLFIFCGGVVGQQTKNEPLERVPPSETSLS